jgi:ribonuclease HI
MTAVAYTDASYSSEKDISACGYVVLVDGKVINHEVLLVEGLKTPTNAEIFAVIKAAEYCFMINGVKNITINTDCKTIISRKRSRRHHMDLDETIAMIKEEGIGLNLVHVRGHKGNYFNNLVDESCLQNLRAYINSKQHENK